MKHRFWKRAAALLLAVILCAALVPTAALAAELEDAAAAAEETEITSPETPVTPESPEEPAQPADEPEETVAEPEETIEPEKEITEPAKETAEPEETMAEQLPAGQTVTVNSADANGPVGLVAEATRDSIILHLNRVGDSGTARVYRYHPESYFSGDSMRGLSTNLDDGEYIAEYNCGASEDITCARYTSDGVDHLYDKYYVLQGTRILSGPVYASEIYSFRNVGRFDVVTKKGLTVEDGTTIQQAIDMGVGSTVVNWDMCSLIYANEDANGNPIDNSSKDVYEFESNGETFYFDAGYVKEQDGLISAYSRAGINVSLVIISWAKTRTNSYPEALRYNTNNQDTQTMAFNTSTERGRRYWVAAMEFLAERYSRSSQFGVVNQFIIGNEIDYTYDWYLLQPQSVNGVNQRMDFNTFMEEFARTFRLANLAVKKYNAGAKVVVSLTHNWAESCLTSYGFKPTSTTTVRYNSYAPKDIVDWLSTYEKARGDYDWGLSVHPYPIGTTSSNPTTTDLTPPGVAKPITGDCNTSPWITAANLELYQLYLDKPVNQYKGQTRTVSITEGSICNLNRDKVSAEEYRQSLYEQAASVAQYYYRAACIPCINEIDYFEYHDQGTYKLGLAEENGTEKPSCNVWRYVDTDKSFGYANRYLKYIAPNATSYLDVMDVTKSGFDWAAHWDEDLLMPRKVGDGEVGERSLVTDKTTYSADEPILITAKGDTGDWVGLYRKSDNIDTADAIYEYPVAGNRGALTFKSGRTYDIRAYGVISTNRIADAKLKAGDYVVVLRPGDGSDVIRCPITLSADYSLGAQKLAITTDKTSYIRGEDVIVTAYGAGSSAWAGIYREGEVPGPGGTVSICWYYCNDESTGQISGKPTIIQTTTSNSGGSVVLEPGKYVVYLFSDGGYNIVGEVHIQVEAISDVAPLASITYQLSDPTDGFANGMVTVKRDSDNATNTDCVMFWADENGVPLEGYAALAKFKLTGETTKHPMYAYSIIPEGAKKLVAYGANGSALSEQAVSCDLPEGCTYHLDKAPVEFQIISDVHVTTDAGATNEVRLSNQHFSQMLEDVKANSPDSVGIFINGDIANTGSNEEYQKVYNLYQRALAADNGKLPYIHMAIGNHDWIQGNPGNQFQKWVKIYNNDLDKQPEKVYYDEVVAGYHFVYLGGEKPGLHANLSKEQLNWFDQVMARCTEEDPDRPVFVFLHQSFYNTVAGSLPGQGWDGVDNENALKRVMQKYGQIILLNGHSHWELNSTNCIYGGDDMAPAALNTAAVGYLWSSYNVTAGEFMSGSHGYFVRVYPDKVVFLGRSFETGEYIPSAMFVVQRNDIDTDSDEYNMSLNKAGMNLGAQARCGGPVEYTSEDTSVASVLEDGTVIARRAGDVKIRMKTHANDTHVIGQKTVLVHISNENVFRVYGDDRYATSLKVADAVKEQLGLNQFDTVILAYGRNYADALAGSYLSCVKQAPILLVDARSQHIEAVQEYIRRNLKPGGTIYLLGGDAVVPDKAVEGLNEYSVARLWGKDRYETNIAILKEAGVKGDEVLICSGTGFADSLSAASTGRPILLVRNQLQDRQKEYLNTLKGKTFYVIGGSGAVSDAVMAQVGSYGKVSRVDGTNRYETSANVAGTFFNHPAAGVLAFGGSFPDGLCGGLLAYSMDAPLLLVVNGRSKAAADYAVKSGMSYGAVLGGPGLIDNATAKSVFGLDSNADIVIR